MRHPRRCKILDVSIEQFGRLLSSLAGHSAPLKVEGWPEDAEVLWPFIDPNRGVVSLVVASESFPEVRENAVIEVVDLRRLVATLISARENS